MINVNSNGQPLSADFVSALTAENRTYDGRLLMNGSVLDCSVNSITVTKGSCGSDTAFTIGNVVGSTLVADVEDLQVSVKGQEIEAQIGIEINGAFEYVTLGKFVVSEAPQNVYKTTITAYGATITRTGAGFNAPSSKTLANIASSIASSMSALAGRTITVTFDSGITTSKTITADMSNLTVYQALQILASVVGGYAIDTYDGNVKICRFSDTPTLSRTVDTMLDLPIVEEPFEISGVLCVVSTDTQYPATPTGNENLIIRNQYVTQDLYNSYLATLTGYEYRPADIGLTYGDPRLEGNDVVQITDIDESVYIIPCHMLTHVYAGGFSTQVKSSQATEQANDVATSAGSLTEQISTIGANAISARASAESARQSAESAEQSATTAYNLASQVEGLAQQANQNAQSAQQSASQASQSASQALSEAQSANSSALSALRNLSTVENVVDTLEWITAHGTMESQAGKTFDANKVYFVVDQNGDYVVQNVHYSIVANPQASQIANYYCLSVDESIQNYIATHVVIDSEGLWLIPDDTQSSNRVLIAVGGQGHTYSTAGMYIIDNTGAVVANFKADGAVIGQNTSGKSRSVIGESGMQIYHKRGNADEQIANFGYGEGQAQSGTDIAPYYTFGTRKETTDEYDPTKAYNIGDLCLYDDGNGYKTYICKLEIDTPEPWNPLRWGVYIGNMSVAEGYKSIASGVYSHTEGRYTINNGFCAHTEGESTKVFSDSSHAEGYNTIVRGAYAQWCFSHVSGRHTVSNGKCRTVIGSYNVDDLQIDRFIGDGVTTRFTTTQLIGNDDPIIRVDGRQVSYSLNYGNTIDFGEAPQQGSLIEIFYSTTENIFIIGNGDQYARSNALTVDWSGNVKASGNIIDGVGNILSAKANSANMFYITNVTPSGYNFDPNQYRSLSSSNITIYSGYTPIIVQARCTNKSGLHVFNYSISGTTLNYEVINRTGSQVNGANFAFRILHIRNELIG